MKICPKCSRKFERLLAVSRVDNKTMICDDCGTMEALDSVPHGVLIEKVRDLVIKCANCLCQYCVNNAEGDKGKSEEMQEPCFICDECSTYDGDCRKRNQRKEECSELIMSDYGAGRNRKRIKLIKG